MAIKFYLLELAMKFFVTLSCVFLLSACSAEVGSEQWCIDLKEKPKGDWTVTQAKDYAQHCLFK